MITLTVLCLNQAANAEDLCDLISDALFDFKNFQFEPDSEEDQSKTDYGWLVGSLDFYGTRPILGHIAPDKTNFP